MSPAEKHNSGIGKDDKRATGVLGSRHHENFRETRFRKLRYFSDHSSIFAARQYGAVRFPDRMDRRRVVRSLKGRQGAPLCRSAVNTSSLESIGA